MWCRNGQGDLDGTRRARRRLRLCAGGLIAALCVLSASPPALATGTGTRTFAIPAAPLSRALGEFATQSGSQLLYPPALVEGRQAGAVSGRLSPSEALAQLLLGSGLQVETAPGGVFVLRVAPSAAARPPARPPATADAFPVAPGSPQPLRRVLVTGSRIPRAGLDTTTPISVIRRDEIETAGFTTLFDLLRHQPGMTGHHVVDAATETISQSLTSLVSTAVAQSASLYGLGPRGTLYLVDGRRVANYALPSSSLGGLNDLGAIPLSMVERVDILRGGASAVYGADAVAGVVNIILRRDAQGGDVGTLYGRSERGDAETHRVSFGAGVPLGDGHLALMADHLRQAHLAGTSRAWHTRDRSAQGLADDTTALGYYGADDVLIPSAPCVAANDPADPACRLDRERYRSLRPAADSTSARAHWRHPLPALDDAELHVQLRTVQTDARMVTGPTTLWNIPVPADDALRERADAIGHAFYDVGPIRSHNRADIVDGMLGLRLGTGDWTFDAEVSRSVHRVDNTVRGVVNQGALRQAIAGGTYHFDGRANGLAALRTIAPALRTHGRSALDAVTLRGTGALGDWRGGTLRAAAGVDARRDSLDYRPDPYFADPELAAPLDAGIARARARHTAAFGELDVPFGPRAWLELAGRLDRAGANGSEFSPRLGAAWRPHAAWLVRGSVADAFRAPTLYEVLGHPPPDDYYGLDVWVDAGAVAPCATEIAGGCVLRIGVATNPALAPERARTRNVGAVWSPRAGLDVALDHFAVRRRHEIAIASAVVDDAIGLDSLVRDEAGRATGFVTRYANTGRTEVRGVHIDADWTSASDAAPRWRLRLVGHYLTRVRHDDGGAPDGVDQAGHLAPRMAATASWYWRAPAWDTALHLRHFGGYRVHQAGAACPDLHAAAGRCRNPSVNLLAAHVGRDVADGWRVSAHVDNLTDRQPANYDPSRTGYNGAIDDPVGRAYALRVSKRF